MKRPFLVTRRKLLGLGGFSLGVGALVTWFARSLGKSRSNAQPIK